ncbi:MAG TPA: hypothetical protein VL360_04040 [Gammaproteobacteria bacterium]|jgi:hypothetical protein|nr:hypothetical protein [Gammaproteobacteria bacterium]
MRKNFLLILSLIFFQTAVFAAVKHNNEMTLDFTLNYQNHGSIAEHVMKNTIHVAGDKWQMAGKFVGSKNDEVIILMVKLIKRTTSKFTFQYMVIDSDNKGTYVSEPIVKTMAGLPTQTVVSESGRTITLNSLVNLSPKQA